MTTPAPSAGRPGATVGPATPTTTPSTTAAESALLAAFEDALAAEQQAVWGYPVLGPRVAADLVDLARAAGDAHMVLVDTASATLADLGRTPVAPQVDYPLPSAVATPAEAVAYALDLEKACASAWRWVVVRGAAGTDVGGIKPTAVDALTATAVRAARWAQVSTPDSPTVPFPGAGAR